MYPQQDFQPETHALRGKVPGYPASQNPGMNQPHYTYGDGNCNIPQPGPSVRSQEDSWASPGTYGILNHYPWPTAAPAAPPSNLYMSENTSWPGNGSPHPSHPPPSPPQQPKDSSYPYGQSDQGMNQHNFPCSVHQYQFLGTKNSDHSHPVDSQVQYSAEPQLYGNITNEHPSNQDQNNLPEEPLSSDQRTLAPESLLFSSMAAQVQGCLSQPQTQKWVLTTLPSNRTFRSSFSNPHKWGRLLVLFPPISS